VYTNPAAAAAGSGAIAGSGLAMTGFNVVWLLLAAFALVAAGTAVLRLLPRREA
jgi:hypothetical protein